jgi:hypothetical protein
MPGKMQQTDHDIEAANEQVCRAHMGAPLLVRLAALKIRAATDILKILTNGSGRI